MDCSHLGEERGQNEESSEGYHYSNIKDGGPEEEGEVADDHEDEGGDVDGEDGIAVKSCHGDPHPGLSRVVIFFQQHLQLTDLGRVRATKDSPL